jgi:hypothetical protein
MTQTFDMIIASVSNERIRSMAEQGSTAPTPTPLPQGGQTRAGDLPSGRLNFSFSPPLSKGTPISETLSPSVGGPVSVGVSVLGKGPRFVEGFHSPLLGSILAELDVVNRSGLTPEQTLVAQILQGVRNFVIAQEAVLADKPIRSWDVHDILRAAKGGAL